jgi:hypothetical protein
MTPDEAAPGGQESEGEGGKTGPTGRHQAYTVETVVMQERGQWAVDIIVLFDDEVIRKRISTYRSERLALISADLIRRTAEREITGPTNG